MLQAADVLLQLAVLVAGCGCVSSQRQQLVLHLVGLHVTPGRQRQGKTGVERKLPL
jgi:hypothetical protein